MPVNNTEPLSVYPAGPGYAPCLAAMILASSRAHRLRGFVDRLLDLREPAILKLLARLALDPGQLCGRIDNAYVALVDGVCAGMVTVRPAGRLEEYPFSPGALEEAASALRLDAAWTGRVLERQRDFVSGLPRSREPMQEGVWFVEHLAVRYENRSAGVARGLLDRVGADARGAGGTVLELYCETGNARAEALCATLGFVPASPEAPGPRLMRKIL